MASPVVSLVSAARSPASSPVPGPSEVSVSSGQPSSFDVVVVSYISLSLFPTSAAQSQVPDFLPLALVSPVSSGSQLPPQVITLIIELYRFARPDSTSRGTQTDTPESPGKDSSTSRPNERSNGLEVRVISLIPNVERPSLLFLLFSLSGTGPGHTIKVY